VNVLGQPHPSLQAFPDRAIAQPERHALHRGEASDGVGAAAG
jgi:hypothetical protein